MAAIRLYLVALTLVFIIAVMATIGIGVLEATVMTSVPLLLILDIREELKEIKLLEERLAALTQ
ncbi:MAG TPA: hypothetical protein VFH15_15300 [Pyrinomonadaceae bacterium]|nr:hypothetical protein [Pyrinomonadaceae bacterium]